MNLNKSRQFIFDIDLKASSIEVEPFFSEYIHYKSYKYKDAFKIIIANLAYDNNYIALGLSKDYYHHSRNNTSIGASIFLNILKWMRKENYIEWHRGYYNKGQTSRLTRIKALPKFENKIKEVKIVRDAKGLIVLKNRRKQAIEYKETKRVKIMKEQLKVLNQLYKESEFVLFQKVLPQAKLYRVFNNSSFKLGGRYYGAHFQWMTREDRLKILVNQKPLVELDYSCLHISMLYAKKKIQWTGDAYSLEGFKRLRHRSLLKHAVNIMLNSSSPLMAKRAIKISIHKFKYPEVDIDMMMNKILEKHALIKEFFFRSEQGLRLQYEESRLAEQIIDSFIKRKKKRMILPIHDGFLVHHEDRDYLFRLMKRIYRQKYKQDIEISEKKRS